MTGTNSRTSTYQLVRRMLSDYLKPYLGQLVVAILFMLLSAATTGAFAGLVEPVLDDVLYGAKGSMIVPVATGFFVVFFIKGFSTYLHTIIMNRIGQSIVMDIQNDLFGRFMSLDLAFFNVNPSGHLVSRIISDVNVMRIAVSDTMTGLGKSLLTLLFLICIMFMKDWKLSIAAFLIFPLAAAFVSCIGRRLRKVSVNIQYHLGLLSDQLTQVFNGIRLVKAYAMEGYEKDKVKQANGHIRDLMVKSVNTGQLSTPVNELLVGIVVSAIIIYGGFQVQAGHTTAGALLSFITAFTLAYEPMKKLASLNNTLQLGLGAADRVYEMIDLRARIVDRENPLELVATAPEIVFDNVSFNYGNDESRLTLGGVSCVIPGGKVTALVGPSGGGKTTMMNMILRFYEANEGSILVDGVDVRDISLESLRRNIALVSQDITIFDDSAYANIAYGRMDASEEEIIEAARAAEAHDFIIDLPEGYNTKVGENGVLLSGGQRQRIAIARAILRNAPILLLDEATSALDNDSERAIQKTLAKLQEGRTTLVIAHRLSTIKNASQILVLENGNIIERGNHDDLLKLEGTYARLYRMGVPG